MTLAYRPVIDRFVAPVPLDPLAAVLFVAAFVAAALLTARRPAYGVAALILSIPFDFAHELAGTTITLEKCVLVGVVAGLATHRGIPALLRSAPVRLIAGGLTAYCIVCALTLLDAAHRGPAVRET
ncbi:MAG: hypothetical protein JO350_00530, partial [Candidatus Eremiobacteraeota bacterium]|nr:hypothetical protein [Candidatus Eremiobacteraeota bacterium]